MRFLAWLSSFVDNCLIEASNKISDSSPGLVIWLKIAYAKNLTQNQVRRLI